MQLNSFHFDLSLFHEFTLSGHCRIVYYSIPESRGHVFTTCVSKEKARDGSQEVIGNGHGDDGRVLVPSPGDQSVVLECNSDSDAF